MTTAQIKALQDSLVKQGYMTQAEVNTGYGIYGPKTTRAVAAYESAVKAHPAVSSAIQQYGNFDSAYAASGGDLSNMKDSYGTPFSAADQGAAVNDATAAGKPYFEAEKAKDQADTAASLGGDIRSFDAYQKTAAANFQDAKTEQDTNAAEKGVLFSGGRVQKLNRLGSEYSADLAAKKSALGEKVGNTSRDFQYKYGNEAANNLSEYYSAGGSSYNPHVASGGVSSTGLSSIYNPGAYNFQGTKVNAAKAAAQQRAAGLLWNKGNKIVPLGYKNQY